MVPKMICTGLVLMMLAGSGIAYADNNWKGRINWRTYDEVQPEEKGSSQKIFIYFFSKRCGYCRMLEKKSFTNDTIVNYINQHYTPIIVDTDKQNTLAARAGVNGVPDLRFLTREGKPIARLPGYVPPDTLLNLLQYIQTDSYKTMALKDFVKNKKID